MNRLANHKTSSISDVYDRHAYVDYAEPKIERATPHDLRRTWTSVRSNASDFLLPPGEVLIEQRLGEVADAINRAAIADDAKARLTICQRWLGEAVGKCGALPDALVIAAATPNGGIVLASEGWPAHGLRRALRRRHRGPGRARCDRSRRLCGRHHPARPDQAAGPGRPGRRG